MTPSSDKKQNLTFKFSLTQAFFWMNFSAIMGFTSIYLLNAGLNNTQIGIVIAIGGLISAILQPIIASYADRPESPSLKKIILFLAALIIALGVLLSILKQPILLISVLYGGCITILQLITPLLNALGMESLNQGKYLNFGVSRGMGSISYAALSSLLGFLVANIGPECIPIAITVGFALLLLAVYLYPFAKQAKPQKQNVRSSQSPIEFFKKYKQFTIVLVGCILLYLSHTFLNSFTFQIVSSKGGNSADMGNAMAIASIIELPTMLLFGYVQKKIRCDILFRCSGIFFMLKTLGTLLAPNMTLFYLMQFLQIGGWALISVSSVYYVNSIMAPEDVIKGQAYFTMTYTLGSVLGALLGGALLDLAGVNSMLLAGTLAAALGMLIQLLATQRPANA